MDAPLTPPATSYHCIFWECDCSVPPNAISNHIFNLFSCDKSQTFLFLVIFGPIWWFPWAPPSPFKCINGKISSLNILVSIVGFLYSIESNFVYLTKHENSMNPFLSFFAHYIFAPSGRPHGPPLNPFPKFEVAKVYLHISA